jgi:hypothetical protein
MTFKAKVSLIKLDKRGFINHLNEEMTETTKEAAKSWLRTVVVNIPIWSRASIATFNALAESVGFPLNVGTPVSNVDRLGLGLSTGRGGLRIEKNKSWKFFYETDLRYLAWNEFNKPKKGDGSGWYSTHRDGPGPLRFIDSGTADFESFSKEVKLPNPIEFISPQRI